MNGHIVEVYPYSPTRRERFWLRVVSFAVKRANRAGGLHRGMTKYHWTHPAREYE